MSRCHSPRRAAPRRARLIASLAAALVAVALPSAASAAGDGNGPVARAAAKKAVKGRKSQPRRCTKAQAKRRPASCAKKCTKKASKGSKRRKTAAKPVKACPTKSPRTTRQQPAAPGQPPAQPAAASAPAPAPAAPAANCCATAPAPAAASVAAPSTSGGPSAWDRPALNNPIRLHVNASYRDLKLDLTKDYILDFGSGVNSIPGGMSIWGGHNVVIDGGHVDIPTSSGALALKNQTGTMWIHNFQISGPNLLEGIDLDQRQPGATVVLRNVKIDTVHGTYQTNHADLLQTWAGPSRLLIDGFTGSTTYQGFFLLPNQMFSGPRPAVFDFRHIDIQNDGGYALWRDDNNPYPQYVQDVWVRPNPLKMARDWWLWPKPSAGDHSWDNVISGTPPGGSFVQSTDAGVTGISDVVPPAPLSGEQP